MKIIAHIHTGFTEKFGIPRQSGLVDTEGVIVFEPEFAVAEAVRGLEEFSHIWLIWDFSKAHGTDTEANWSPTVRPPRLGGNKRIGVFATRSPFRPNHIGLSCVRLEAIEKDDKGRPLLRVRGADLLDGTPIYDIKPYLPYADCRPAAVGGFAIGAPEKTLEAHFECELPPGMSEQQKIRIKDLIEQDPRPAYKKDGDRIYGMAFDGYEIKFKIDKGVAEVIDISTLMW